MRKNQLRLQIDYYCRNDHTGSHQSRKHRYFVLHKMIRDLHSIGHVPPKWHAVTEEHIQQLVKHWQQKEQLNTSTLMKYLTIIRNFFKKIEHELPGISNQELGLKRCKCSLKVAPQSIHRFDNLTNPIAKLLLELQVYFGLTLSEAMRLCPNIHLQDNFLWVTRDIAKNSLDRMIPIRIDKQLEIIQLFQTHCKKQNLILTHGYHTVRNTYSLELNEIGLPSSKGYRYLYAKNTYSELCKALSPYLAKQTLMREMGLQSRRTLWSYLNEQH